MSEKKCCVPGCIESGRSHRVLHLFPKPEKDQERFNSWLRAIGGDILSLSNEYIYRRRRVCHAHFEEKYCCRLDRISNIAVPTLNIPDPLKLPSLSMERRPLRLIQQTSECVPSCSNDTAYGGTYYNVNKENISASQVCVPSTSKNTDSLHVTFENVPLNPMEGDPTTKKVCCAVSKRKQHLKTTAEQQLYRKLMKLRIKLSKTKNTVKKQLATLKAAKNITANQKFRTIMEDLPSSARLLIMMQYREIKKKDKGRRFSLEEKILALAIFKQSAKAYRFLRKLLILPAPQTLIKLLQRANVQPGISKTVFAQLKKKVDKMRTEDRLCILIYDEMALKANLQYNERKDKVIGFVTDGEDSTAEFADHAQVFMVRGIIKNYKQPVSYTFSQAATKGPQLASQIKKYIQELQETGLIVVATICDQGANNRSAIKILLEESRSNLLRQGEELRGNHFLINNQEIVPLYDPPHMLKCVRNNLLTKDLQFKVNEVTKTAKWQHLEMLHKENPGYKGMRLIPKLTDNHIIPHKIGKMKVKYAAQIFSQTVGKTMGYLADKEILPSECKDTADALIFFDKLFDSLNGSYNKGSKKFGKPLLGPVSPNSTHHGFWMEAKKILNTMKFIKKDGKIDNSVSLINWAWTLDGIQDLLKKLHHNFNINSVWMRHFNQDPLENFFGGIRSQGCRNINPTPEQFESAYATLLVNNLTSDHAPGTNCEQDFCEALQVLVLAEDCTVNKPTNIIAIPKINLMPLELKASPQVMAPLQYVSGYFLKQIKKKVFKDCKICNKKLFAETEIEYIKYREYAGGFLLFFSNYPCKRSRRQQHSTIYIVAGIAKWSHIVQFHELDNTNPNYAFAPLLKPEHLNPNTKQKMRVKLAVQVLSHTVSSGMYARIGQGLPAGAIVTADLISKMDKLFDTPDLRRGKPLSSNLRNLTPHLEFIKEMKNHIQAKKFIGATRTPPSQEGWIWTLNGVKKLWHTLRISDL